jgi:hypothetical protein
MDAKGDLEMQENMQLALLVKKNIARPLTLTVVCLQKYKGHSLRNYPILMTFPNIKATPCGQHKSIVTKKTQITADNNHPTTISPSLSHQSPHRESSSLICTSNHVTSIETKYFEFFRNSSNN